MYETVLYIVYTTHKDHKIMELAVTKTKQLRALVAHMSQLPLRI